VLKENKNYVVFLLQKYCSLISYYWVQGCNSVIDKYSVPGTWNIWLMDLSLLLIWIKLILP